MTTPPDNLRKDLDSEEFQRFRDWIHNQSGIYLEDNASDSLRISLAARATRLGFLEYDEYFNVLSRNEEEFKELMNLVTINETSFFRFPGQFDALRDRVIPEILENKPRTSRSFRVWSAGCSTGEEPYSIAMTLLDSALKNRDTRTEIIGTDVSTAALDRAKAAVYPAKALASLPQNIVQRWFEPVAGGHRPNPQVRDAVMFSYCNLIEEPYPPVFSANWDIIFCRNVTIYFRPESTRRVIDNFCNSLNPGGYLFVGHSETLTSISDRFESVEVGGVFLYRKPPAKPRIFGSRLPTGSTRRERTPRVDPLQSRKSEHGTVSRGDLRRATAEETRSRRAARAVPVPVPEPTSADNGEPGEVEELVAEARHLLEIGEPARARSVADLALAKDKRHIGGLLARAHANADTGDIEAAIADASEALRVDSMLASGHYILGIIYLRQNDIPKALDEFKRTIYISQDFVLAHFNMANLYRAREAFDDACREYENSLKALYLSPNGEWTEFLGGFKPDLLAMTCERSLIECRKRSTRR